VRNGGLASDRLTGQTCSSNVPSEDVANSSDDVWRGFGDPQMSAHESFEPILHNQEIVALGAYVDMFVGSPSLMFR
jgi:hypothetical protein